jgi:hypothetical protein
MIEEGGCMWKLNMALLQEEQIYKIFKAEWNKWKLIMEVKK